MEALLQRFFKHALKCEQCSEHPDNPCAIGTLIMSAAASVAIISAQQGAQAAGADAKKTTNTEGGAE
jgi:hypothetical protein